MTHPMTNPSTPEGERGETALYLIVSGGDGYNTRIVTEAELEDAFIAVHYGDGNSALSCPPDERQTYIDNIRDEDNWTIDYGARLAFHASYEDGYVSIFRLFDSEKEIAATKARAATLTREAADLRKELAEEKRLSAGFEEQAERFGTFLKDIGAAVGVPTDRPMQELGDALLAELAEARRDGMEEAAVIVEQWPKGYSWTHSHQAGVINDAPRIAAAIRAAIDSALQNEGKQR